MAASVQLHGVIDEATLEREPTAVGAPALRGAPAPSRNPLKALDDRAMDLASRDAELSAALFRFVDVVPACRSLDDLARHLTGFLDEVDEPPAADRGRDAHGQHEGGPRGARRARRPRGVKHMAHRFIVGETPRGRARRPARACGATASPRRSTCSARRPSPRPRPTATRRAAPTALDTLARGRAPLAGAAALERDCAGPLPRANLSVKVSALTPLLRPDAPERGKRDAAERLRRAAAPRASELGAHLHIDMESLDSREAVLELVLELLAEPEFRDGPSAGMVLQAYLRDSPQTLDTSSAGLGAQRRARARRSTIRLVKGAYWDHEVVEARQHGWAAPVFEDKADSRPQLRGAHPPAARRAPPARCASRSPRTTCARSRTRSPTTALAGGDDADLELQVLRGLGDDLAGRARRAGPPRAHLLPGRRPRRRAWPTSCAACSRTRATTRSSRAGAGRRSRSCSRRRDGPWRPRQSHIGGRRVKRASSKPVRQRAGPRAAPRRRPRAALARRAGASSTPRLPLRVPVVDRRRARRTSEDLDSTDPGATPERVVADAPARARPPADVDARGRAPRGAARASGARARPPSARSVLLRGRGVAARAPRPSSPRSPCASARSRGREADADVCEAIDFLEYYARGARRARTRGAAAAAGARASATRMRYAPRGVVAVIAPWNFPLAIPLRHDRGRRWRPATPRSSSPPSSRPRCALALVEALREAGVPPDALALLPGEGDAGAALVRAPAASHTIAFTGSAAGRPGDRARGRRDRRPASATSSAWSPRWAARTA